MVKNDSFFLWTDAQSWHNTEKFFEDTKKRTESEKQLSGKRKDEKMEEVMILAEKIINLRKKNGWSQEELAEILGMSRVQITREISELRHRGIVETSRGKLLVSDLPSLSSLCTQETI